MEQEAIRSPGEPQAKLPKTSRLLDELAQENKLNLLDKSTRDHLQEFLADVAANAPVVHVSFAADPSSAFLQKIVQWFRDNVHGGTLVRVGLQPTIGAGCTVQTTNKFFDLSLRRHLQRNRQQLFRALVGEDEPAATSNAAPEGPA
jgi:F0F1-type ATP synthase delta subunit